MEEVISEAKERMKKAVGALQDEFNTLRTGRASPALFEKIRVEYYGNATPLNQVATISAPEARLVVIQPWDKSMIGHIEKALLKADLGLNVNSDGNVIRITIPELTEERRIELVKHAKKVSEEGKIAIRNLRREANNELKKQEKSGKLPEDDSRREQSEVQDLTDEHISKIDEMVEAKEEEIMEF